MALQGQGNWTTINGARVFVPFSRVSDWQPYQHGYWYWSRYGWAWQSYDNWGWITDHYGYWRHHRAYGWVWSPFSWTGRAARWYPAVVSFYNTGSHIGWSPYWDYWDGASPGYSHGYADGYDDGFWDGYAAGTSRSSYSSGYTCVNNGAFLSGNIYHSRVSVDVAVQVYSDAYRGRSYGRGAMVYGNSDGARTFIESRTGRPVVVVDVEARRTRIGGSVDGMMVRPRTVLHETPPEYINNRDLLTQRLRAPGIAPRVPIGSVIDDGGAITIPARLGRDVVTAPRFPGRDGTIIDMPARTRLPVAGGELPTNIVNRPGGARPDLGRPPTTGPNLPPPHQSRPPVIAPTPARPPVYTQPAPARPPAYTQPAPARPPVYTQPAPARPPAFTQPAPAARAPVFTQPAPARPPALTQPAPARPPAYTQPAPARPPALTQPAPARPPALTQPAPARPPALTQPAPARPPVIAPTPARPPVYTQPAPARPPAYTQPAPARPPMVTQPAPARPPVIAPRPIAPTMPSLPRFGGGIRPR